MTDVIVDFSSISSSSGNNSADSVGGGGGVGVGGERARSTTVGSQGSGRSLINYQRQMSESSGDADAAASARLVCNYTLADVYDDAAVIGSELEKIISNYGADVLKDLMPKVISVLELLENLTIRKEKENDQVNDLKMRINSLEMEKMQRMNERDKFEKVYKKHRQRHEPR
jgi:hypothetical protein